MSNSRSPSRRQLSFPAAPLLVAGLSLHPFGVAAQELRSVEWTEMTRIELPGALGLMVRALPGLSTESESRHALHQQGRMLATTDNGSTTIIDLGERRIVAVDHEDGSYMSITFDESAAAMREMAAAAAEARAGAEEALREADQDLEQAREEMRQAMAEAQAEFRVNVTSEATGRTESVNGMRAQQYFLVADIDAISGVDGVEGTDEGSLSFLVELWQTDEFPDLDEVYEAWAREMAGDAAIQELAGDMAEAMEPLTADGGWEALSLWNPGVAAGLAQLGEAMSTLEGTTVRSVTHVAFVPPGVELDREALLAWQPGSMGDEVRGAAGSAVQGAARGAVQGAVGGITRGLFGGANREPEPEPEEPAAVRPLLRMTQEKADIQVGSASAAAAAFQIPAGYEERSFPSLQDLR